MFAIGYKGIETAEEVTSGRELVNPKVFGITGVFSI